MKELFFALSLAVLFITGCDNGNKSGIVAMEAPMAFSDNEMAMVPPPPQEMIRDGYDNADEGTGNNAALTVPEDKKKIIKDGNISITVNDLEAAKREVDTLIKIFDGYYSNERMFNNEYSQTYDLTIRVPAQGFEPLIKSIEAGKGEVTSKIINARDVTEEYFDLESRLANKRSYLERYRELLRQAKTVKEILEIEQQIRTIIEEIDSTEGRLKYLGDQVAYSTLNLTITREKSYIYRPKDRGPFGERLKHSLSGGWNGFVAFTLLMVRLWPAWIILAVTIPLVKRFLRKRKK